MPGSLLDLSLGRQDSVLAKPHARFIAKSKRHGEGRKVEAGKARSQEKLLRLLLRNTYLKPTQVGWYQCTKANG